MRRYKHIRLRKEHLERVVVYDLVGDVLIKKVALLLVYVKPRAADNTVLYRIE